MGSAMTTHITIAAEGRATLFVGAAAITTAARLVARVGGERLELFAIVDDHVHLLVRGDGGGAASGMSRAMRAAGAAGLQHAFLRAVEGRTHHTSLIGYLCRQVVKHGLREHPALYAGTCAPDLLGVRALAEFDARRIGESLPRLDVRAEAARSCGVGPGALRAATDAEIAAIGTARLWAIARGAGGIVGSERDYHAVAVRAAFASLATGSTSEVATATGLGDRMVRRLRSTEPDARLVEAIRRRVALCAWLEGQTDKVDRIPRDPVPSKPSCILPSRAATPAHAGCAEPAT